jgi:hypothetical protein
MGDEREVAELSTKMDMMIDFMKELKTELNTNYVQKVQFEDLKERVLKIENAPFKWLSMIIAIAGGLMGVLSYLKH